VHLRIYRNNVQKYLDTLCADYISEKDKFPEFLRENREKIFSSGIMLRRSGVYGNPATLKFILLNYYLKHSQCIYLLSEKCFRKTKCMLKL